MIRDDHTIGELSVGEAGLPDPLPGSPELPPPPIDDEEGVIDMGVATIIQKQLVDAVTAVVITDIAQDIINPTLFVREIRVYGPPDAATGANTLQYTLRVESNDRAAIELTAPAAHF